MALSSAIQIESHTNAAVSWSTATSRSCSEYFGIVNHLDLAHVQTFGLVAIGRDCSDSAKELHASILYTMKVVNYVLRWTFHIKYLETDTEFEGNLIPLLETGIQIIQNTRMFTKLLVQFFPSR
eukprot:398134_1